MSFFKTFWVAAFMLSMLMISSCHKSPPGSGPVGVFRGTGVGFVEEISLVSTTGGYQYHHIVRSGNQSLCDELNGASISGNEVVLTNFTVWIDSKSASLLTKSDKFLSSRFYFLDGPPFEMLKPFPEHDYFLKKVVATSKEMPQ
jgi:hypothetical protein